MIVNIDEQPDEQQPELFILVRTGALLKPAVAGDDVAEMDEAFFFWVASDSLGRGFALGPYRGIKPIPFPIDDTLVSLELPRLEASQPGQFKNHFPWRHYVSEALFLKPAIPYGTYP